MRILLPAAILAFLGLSCKADRITTQPVTPQYDLIWYDEFNNEGPPDNTKWTFENGFVRNQEDQWYQPENAVCTGGNLVITGRKERKPNPNYVAGSTDWKKNRQFIDYTSASVVMKPENAFQYGKLEVRAKIDAQTGLWPAIWTLGVTGEWPSNGEVDVMEYYGDNIRANFAIGSATRFQAIWDGFARNVNSFGDPEWSKKFHTWTMEWDSTYMRIAVDGTVMNSINVNTSINKSDGKNPFRQPHYLLMNLAMGGTNGGSLAATNLPSQYMIDYVRIYKRRN